MTREDAICRACEIVALAYHTRGNYDRPSDGFCHECVAMVGRQWGYQNAGETLDYVEHAVIEKLERDGLGDECRRIIAARPKERIKT